MATTKKIDNVIAQAEAKFAETADALRSELATINDTLPALQQKAQDIADGITAEDEVLRRLRNDEHVAPLELHAARESDEIVGLRLAAKTKRAKVLSNNLPPESNVLADKIAPYFENVFPGMTVVTTIAPSKMWVKDVPEGTSAIVLCVDKVEQDPWHQTYSGTVKAHYIRSGLMRPIPVAALEAAHQAARPGFAMTVKSNVVGDEEGFVGVGGSDKGNQSGRNALVLDTLTIQVSGVVDGYPVLSKVQPDSSVVKTWVMAIFGGFTRPGVVTTARVYDVSDIGKEEAFVIKYGLSSVARATHPEANEAIDGDERTLTLKHTVDLQGVDHVAFAREMQDGGNGWVGSSHLGVGVLTAVEVMPRTEGDVRSARKMVDVVLTFKSLTN